MSRNPCDTTLRLVWPDMWITAKRPSSNTSPASIRTATLKKSDAACPSNPASRPWSPYADVGLALIDVPGHVDFLKNAIRGLHRVDLALLVVAADDGVMPQTREHLDILQYFGARGGLVILSKTDLVDPETVEIAKLELIDALQETFLQGKPILEFSTRHPPDTAVITQVLREEVEGCSRNRPPGPFRLWIDQARQLAGIGTRGQRYCNRKRRSGRR